MQNTLRSLMERLSQNVVLKRKLPERFGNRPMFVSPASGLRYWRPSLKHIDPDIFTVVDTFIKPGNTIWDIGTNVGMFSIPAAHRVGPTGHCLSVEPDVWLVNLLNRTVEVNPDLTIDVLPVAVSDRIGFAQFHIAQRSRSTSYLSSVVGSTQTGGIRRTVNVVTTTLDTLLDQFAPPDLLKIDVETAEVLVLRGGTRLLSEVRPIIYCEVTGENNEEVTGLLKGHDYKLFNVEGGQISPATATSQNTLAVPAGHSLLP